MPTLLAALPLLTLPLAGALLSPDPAGAEAPPGGAPALLALPRPASDGGAPLSRALAERHSVRAFRPTPLTLAEVGQLLWAAQGTNRADGRRTAPSAGATYPLELWLVAGAVDGLPAGLYRYLPGEHALRPAGGGDRRAALAGAARGQAWVEAAPAVVAITAVEARTATRYGERAGRYVAIEVGHAAQNLCLQATALGLGSVVVGAFADREVERLLGLPAGERPYLLLPVGRPR